MFKSASCPFVSCSVALTARLTVPQYSVKEDKYEQEIRNLSDKLKKVRPVVSIV